MYKVQKPQVDDDGGVTVATQPLHLALSHPHIYINLESERLVHVRPLVSLQTSAATALRGNTIVATTFGFRRQRFAAHLDVEHPAIAGFSCHKHIGLVAELDSAA